MLLLLIFQKIPTLIYDFPQKGHIILTIETFFLVSAETIWHIFFLTKSYFYTYNQQHLFKRRA